MPSRRAGRPATPRRIAFARAYVKVEAGSREPWGVRVTGGRHAALEGADNVRDLGGYRTADGLVVSAWTLLRGDGLHRLTDVDVESLSGLRTIIDFRTPGEILNLGQDRLPRGAVPVSFPIGGGDLSEVFDLVASGDARRQRRLLGDGRASEFMAGIYRSYVSDDRQREAFAAAISLVCEGPRPVLAHCTSGKDRTGWMAALVLLAAGVPMGDVMADYLASNDYLRVPYQRMRTDLVKAGLLLEPELLRPVMEVSPGYIYAAFHEAELRYGSFESFLRRGAGIDAIRLRRALLTRPG
ncbi:MAG: tyrosine-protein phosphatase [Streptosporangiaceae bacterium]